MSDQANHKAWALQWKQAAARLQSVRDEELRRLQETPEVVPTEIPEQNGLVIFQRWMMRKAILDSRARRD